jgi:sec-independent protein translocase protein TatC
MDDKKQPLTSHLGELRKRLILSFIAMAVGFIACYAVADTIFGILAAPLLHIMQGMKIDGTMIFTSVPDLTARDATPSSLAVSGAFRR